MFFLYRSTVKSFIKNRLQNIKILNSLTKMNKHEDDHLIFYSRMNQNAANKIELEKKEFELATSQLQTAFCIEDIHQGVVGKIPSIKQIIDKSSEAQDIAQMLLRHHKRGGNTKK